MATANSPKTPGLWGLLIVDRYMLRQFVQTFLICFCSLTGLYIVIDAFTNLEEFITYSRDHGSLMWIVGEYYAYRTLSFFDSTSHVITLIAAMFTVTWIQRHNELTALEAAGISRWRIIKPLIVAAVFLVGLKVVNREVAIPAVRENLSYNAQDLGGSRGKQIIPRYDFRTGVLLRASGQAFANEKRIERPDFQLPAGLDRLGSRIVAGHAYFKPAEDGRPSGYLMREVSQPSNLMEYPSLALDGGMPIVLSPKDTPWLHANDCFVVSEVGFEYLVANSNWRQLSSTWDLIRGLQNASLDYGANERTAIHTRVVQPVLDLTLLFLGLPLVLTGSNRNVFMAIGVCLALVVAFMLVVLGCNYLGSSYLLEPSLAAWLPLMIFVPAAVALSLPLRA